ncbi:MAG: tRNA lysidine(34) synthetase TilS [Rhodobacteraceae bacterium]|nr:tRNA lysidine(34) synthetase TilS [Paracoccaceae bacterium]
MALLHLTHAWAKANNVSLSAATVDHGLRPEAADEAQMVAEICAGLGFSHDILHWEDWDRRGNLQNAARRARYALLTSWARENQLDAVALGHTKDDQAETFLMRLARGSGVDGLAAMRRDWQVEGTRWLRPLMGVCRQELREYLTAKSARWVEDPSNDDERFDRVKARRALEALAPLGLNTGRLAGTAEKMTLAREALQQYTFEAAHELCETQSGDVLIASGMKKLPQETLHRLFAHALMWIASAPYRPRYDALVETLGAVRSGERRSLHGCLILPKDEKIRITREYQSVKDEMCASGQVWDNRWRITGPTDGIQVRALGEALCEVPDWRETGLPRMSLMASPAIWRGEVLVGAPLAGLASDWSAEIAPPKGDFFASILLH